MGQRDFLRSLLSNFSGTVMIVQCLPESKVTMNHYEFSTEATTTGGTWQKYVVLEKEGKITHIWLQRPIQEVTTCGRKAKSE